MKKQKTQKGITLIALIITIIVLLILAVVTIGTVQDSDIIGHAENAANKYETEKLQEELKLAISELNMNIYANPSEYSTRDEDGINAELYLCSKMIDVIEKELSFTISNRANNVMSYTYNGEDIELINYNSDEIEYEYGDLEDVIIFRVPVNYKNNQYILSIDCYGHDYTARINGISIEK